MSYWDDDGREPAPPVRVEAVARPERIPERRKITITLTDCEARQVDRALAMRESALERMIAGEVVLELRMVWEDELKSAQSAVHKLGPMFLKLRHDGPPNTGNQGQTPRGENHE